MKFLYSSVISLSLVTTAAAAQDGAIDLAFGLEPGNTSVSFSANDQGTDNLVDILVMPDSRIYLVGTVRHLGRSAFGVSRLFGDGTSDDSYQNAGKMISSPVGELRDFHATTAALQPDGKLVVAGFVRIGADENADRDVVVCRFKASGELDATFDNGETSGYSGCEQYGFSVGGHRWDVPTDMLVQPDGRIVLVGYTTRPGDMYSGLFMRIDSTGKLDTTFYGNDAIADGWSAYPPIDSPDFGGIKFSSLARRANGSFVIGLYSGGAAGDIDEAPSTKAGFFSTAIDGTLIAVKAALDFGASQANLRTQLLDIALGPDQTIYSVGWQETATGSGVGGIGKYHLVDWEPDATFSDDGLYSSLFCELCEDSRLSSIVVQADGKILVAGVRKTDRYRSFVARLDATGTLDDTFGVDGVAGIDLMTNSGNESLSSLGLHAGRPIVAGQSFTSVNDAAFTVVRLTSDSIFASGTD